MNIPLHYFVCLSVLSVYLMRLCLFPTIIYSDLTSSSLKINLFKVCVNPVSRRIFVVHPFLFVFTHSIHFLSISNCLLLVDILNYSNILSNIQFGLAIQIDSYAIPDLIHMTQLWNMRIHLFGYVLLYLQKYLIQTYASAFSNRSKETSFFFFWN